MLEILKVRGFASTFPVPLHTANIHASDSAEVTAVVTARSISAADMLTCVEVSKRVIVGLVSRCGGIYRVVVDARHYVVPGAEGPGLWLQCITVVRLPSPCRSSNTKLQSRACHDLPTNSRLFSLEFDLALFSSECDSFCYFFG